MNWCRCGAEGKAILLPQQGPLIIGAVEDADADVIIDAPTVSGRHARLEVVPTGKGSRSTDFRCDTPFCTQHTAPFSPNQLFRRILHGNNWSFNGKDSVAYLQVHPDGSGVLKRDVGEPRAAAAAPGHPNPRA